MRAKRVMSANLPRNKTEGNRYHVDAFPTDAFPTRMGCEPKFADGSALNEWVSAAGGADWAMTRLEESAIDKDVTMIVFERR
jgi:hypothetical protein